MARGVQVILMNSESAYAPEMRARVLDIHGAKIVAEVDEPALISSVVSRHAANILIANLDPSPEQILPIVAEIASSNPGLAVFAVSGSTDGQLILSVMRAGLREFIPKPIDSNVLKEAFDRIMTQMVDNAPQGELISIMGAAGGVGATTIATNLAIELRELTQAKVCLVDMDFRFGQVATLLDLDPHYTVADLCETTEQLEHQVIQTALVEHSSGVKALCRPLDLSQAEMISAAQCGGILTGLAGMFDYIIVDGPARYDSGARTVLDLSDMTLLTLELVIPDVRNIQRMIGMMREAGYNLDRVRLLVNRIGRDNSILSINDLAKTLRLDVFHAIPDDWASVSSAVNLGEPLNVGHPKSRARLGIRELAERISIGTEEMEDEDSGRRGGLFSKIFSD